MRSGGEKVYLEFTYRRPRLLASTLFALYAVLLGFTASNCIIFSQYTLFAFGMDDANDVLRKGLAVGLLTFVTIVHGVFPKTGVKIQNVLGWIKIGIILFMILSGFYVVIFRPDVGTVPHTGQLAWDHLWDDSSWNWGVIATSLFKVFYSYAGLDNVTNVMNEVKNPVRTLRSVALTALATACGMYFLINVAYFLVVPIDEIRGSGELIAALFFERNVMVVAFAMARMKQEIARQGFLPYSELLSSSRPFNSPLGGFFIHYIPSFLVMVLPPSGAIYSFILEIDGYAAQLIGLAAAVGLVKLRFERPDLKRPFKAWIPAVVVKIILGCALLAAPFFRPPEDKGGMFYATYAIVSLSICVLGVIYWYFWTIAIPRWRGTKLEEETKVLGDGTTITKLRYQLDQQSKNRNLRRTEAAAYRLSTLRRCRTDCMCLVAGFSVPNLIESMLNCVDGARTGVNGSRWAGLRMVDGLGKSLVLGLCRSIVPVILLIGSPCQPEEIPPQRREVSLIQWILGQSAQKKALVSHSRAAKQRREAMRRWKRKVLVISQLRCQAKETAKLAEGHAWCICREQGQGLGIPAEEESSQLKRRPVLIVGEQTSRLLPKTFCGPLTPDKRRKRRRALRDGLVRVWRVWLLDKRFSPFLKPRVVLALPLKLLQSTRPCKAQNLRGLSDGKAGAWLCFWKEFTLALFLDCRVSAITVIAWQPLRCERSGYAPSCGDSKFVEICGACWSKQETCMHAWLSLQRVAGGLQHCLRMLHSFRRRSKDWRLDSSKMQSNLDAARESEFSVTAVNSTNHLDPAITFESGRFKIRAPFLPIPSRPAELSLPTHRFTWQ
ncbi:hypothetical protein NM208_g13488 [Fusarium decemcellulare]|uniref:Uncharacterized protein n=1 Tax=Fusarium decemcellulare TaxID=57161 RepID=A0ACC1RLG5_9HYPO|nr:hypothetical protein NM208_g13488 [Fusarium decemcellulare]